MVEALAALRDHEQASYEYSTSRAAAVEFLRAAREIGIVLREHTARTGCTAAAHRPDPACPVADEHDWAEFVASDDARRHAADLDSFADDR